MKKCKIRKGFLKLFSCGEKAAGTCGRCKRPVCAQHMLSGGRCVDCYHAGDYRDDDDRDDAYDSYDHDDGYDAGDAAAFGVAAAATGAAAQDDGAGLLDS